MTRRQIYERYRSAREAWEKIEAMFADADADGFLTIQDWNGYGEPFERRQRITPVWHQRRALWHANTIGWASRTADP